VLTHDPSLKQWIILYAGQKDDPAFLFCANHANAIRHSFHAPPVHRHRRRRHQHARYFMMIHLFSLSIRGCMLFFLFLYTHVFLKKVCHVFFLMFRRSPGVHCSSSRNRNSSSRLPFRNVLNNLTKKSHRLTDFFIFSTTNLHNSSHNVTFY